MVLVHRMPSIIITHPKSPENMFGDKGTFLVEGTCLAMYVSARLEDMLAILPSAEQQNLDLSVTTTISKYVPNK